MTMPKLDLHVYAAIAGVLMFAAGFVDAETTQRIGLDWDKATMGAGFTLLVGGGTYLMGLKTPTP